MSTTNMSFEEKKALDDKWDKILDKLERLTREHGVNANNLFNTLKSQTNQLDELLTNMDEAKDKTKKARENIENLVKELDKDDDCCGYFITSLAIDLILAVAIIVFLSI